MPLCALFNPDFNSMLPDIVSRGGLTIWKLWHCPRAWVSRGPHEMPPVPFS
ncbi:unnamed protein product [Staurois parvus]|uniref:Uncharacterized protein n=1 Tax=Staurois parvus TaxID=386267 RepID=A0ABN9GRD1_9NEOB|nr:unnamed protein product [Staurois parvus]